MSYGFSVRQAEERRKKDHRNRDQKGGQLNHP
jgi:hypothetical protein